MQKSTAVAIMISGPIIAMLPLIATISIIAIVSILHLPGWQGIWDVAILAGIGMMFTVPAGIVVLSIGIICFIFFKSKPTNADGIDLTQ